MTYTRGPVAGVGFAGDDAAQARVTQDGSQEIALNPWMIDRLRRLYPEIDPNVTTTVKSLVGPEFSDAEIKELKERALRAVDVLDLPTLQGIESGLPVELDRRQARVIDQIVNDLGKDPLARRAQGAYRRARDARQVRIR